MVCCTWTMKLVTFSVIAVVVGLLGTTLTFLWPNIFNKMLDSQLALTKDSLSFNIWHEVPVPIYLRFYMFNWTNYNQASTDKPNLVELGPYTFREHRLKENYTWNDNNQTISYFQNRTWIFEPDLSNGTLDDLITTINVPAIAATYSCRFFPKFAKILINVILESLRTKHYVTKPVREFLFEGYSDKILNLAELVPAKWMPARIPFDKFGWFYTRNGSLTYDGYFNMETGVDDISRLGVLTNWNFANGTSYYSSYCGKINGSAGEIFPPNQSRDSFLEIYVTDLCRSIKLGYKEDSEFQTIPALRYSADETLLANATSNPDNWCFCGDEGRKCHPNGVLNVTLCKWGAPLFISFPHFYHGDSFYRDSVIGMKPEESKHQTVADVEPLSGLPLSVKAALQINVYIEPQTEFTIYSKFSKTPIWFPAFWFQESVEINQEIKSNVKEFLFLSSFGSILAYILIGVAVSTLLTVAIIYITRCKSEDESLYLVSSSSNSVNA